MTEKLTLANKSLATTLLYDLAVKCFFIKKQNKFEFLSERNM
jgi:hypothetical protein